MRWRNEDQVLVFGFCSSTDSTTILKWERLTFRNSLSLWTHQSIDLETICTVDLLFFLNPVQSSGAHGIY